MSDRAEPTAEERTVINAMQRVADRWPAGLYLIHMSDDGHSLTVFRGHPAAGGVEVGTIGNLNVDAVNAFP